MLPLRYPFRHIEVYIKIFNMSKIYFPLLNFPANLNQLRIRLFQEHSTPKRAHLSPFSPIHMPFIMLTYASNRLPQGVRPTVLVVRMGSLVLVEYDHRSLLRILRIMQIPVMAGISGHDRHIEGIRGNDGKILRIQIFQVFTVEHRQPPSWKTTLPEPAPPPLPSARCSCQRGISRRYCRAPSPLFRHRVKVSARS